MLKLELSIEDSVTILLPELVPMVLLLRLGDGETVKYDVENTLALSVLVVGVAVGIFDENSEDESGSTLLLLDGNRELVITLVDKLIEDEVNKVEVSIPDDVE